MTTSALILQLALLGQVTDTGVTGDWGTTPAGTTPPPTTTAPFKPGYSFRSARRSHRWYTIPPGSRSGLLGGGTGISDTRTTPLGGTGATSGTDFSHSAESGRSSNNTAQPSLAKQWMIELLRSPQANGLAGESLTLQEALRGKFGETQQRTVVSRYWKTAQAVATYHVALQAHALAFPNGQLGLNARRPANRHDAELRLQVAEARLNAIQEQANLAQAITWNKSKLPLPSSFPHTGSYSTQYEKLFARRANSKALRLNYILPAEHELIKTHADLLSEITAQPARNGSDAETYRAACAKFLDALFKYNRNIADYALLVSGGGTEGTKLVPMLIRVKSATAKRPNETFSRTPTTHSSGIEFRRVEPASGVESRNSRQAIHSVLVQPERRSSASDAPPALPKDFSPRASDWKASNPF